MGRLRVSSPRQEGEPEECAAILHATESEAPDGEGGAIDHSPSSGGTNDSPDSPTEEAAIKPLVAKGVKASTKAAAARDAVLGPEPLDSDGAPARLGRHRLLATLLLLGACAALLGLCMGWVGPGAIAGEAPAEPVEHQLSAAEVANALSAFARLERPPSEEDAGYLGLQERAAEVVEEMSAADVAKTLEAYATLRRPPEQQLLGKLERRAQQVVGDMSAAEVTATLNAYVELGEQLNGDIGMPLLGTEDVPAQVTPDGAVRGSRIRR